MSGIERTQASNFGKTTEIKNEATEQKVQAKLIFPPKKANIEKLEKQIEDLKEKIKNLRPRNEEQQVEKDSLETLLKVYELQLEELNKEEEKEFPPFFEMG